MFTNNSILKIIYETLLTEIDNPLVLTPHTIGISLPNQNQITIGLILTSAPLHTSSSFSLRTNHSHTYHYLCQRDNDTQKKPKPFTLCSIEDCQSYIDDLCKTIINANFNDFEITLPDGSSYLIMINTSKN